MVAIPDRLSLRLQPRPWRGDDGAVIFEREAVNDVDGHTTRLKK
jgi:hypothetical protein